MNHLSGDREAFAALHFEAVGNSTDDSVTKLYNQLLALLNVRIDEFEARIADACDSFEEEQLREEFICEAAAMDKEILALRGHLENNYNAERKTDVTSDSNCLLRCALYTFLSNT